MSHQVLAFSNRFLVNHHQVIRKSAEGLAGHLFELLSMKNNRNALWLVNLLRGSSHLISG